MINLYLFLTNCPFDLSKVPVSSTGAVQPTLTLEIPQNSHPPPPQKKNKKKQKNKPKQKSIIAGVLNERTLVRIWVCFKLYLHCALPRPFPPERQSLACCKLDRVMKGSHHQPFSTTVTRSIQLFNS